MIPTIWNDFMWHTGLSGSIISMTAYLVTSITIYLLLKKMGTNSLSAVFGTTIFALNLNKWQN
jgi:uncharacterized membrane protein YdjX (TVP38/TMEM64 family)